MGDSAKGAFCPKIRTTKAPMRQPQVGTFWTLLRRDYRLLEPIG